MPKFIRMDPKHSKKFQLLNGHKRRLATVGTIQAFKSPRVERKSDSDERQVNSDGELEEKIKNLLGGPFYDEGKVSFLCLACCCELSSDETVKIHIVNEHESFFQAWLKVGWFCVEFGQVRKQSSKVE
ncbi:unnamed protein product [Allacma fusca]|uniref:Uncharacterized protein n=1 Tax=Allacma fusca TaxID=39272 RepID=A0A8J2Q4I8_9HEXA|nr:unnamed protein product [Allacma fusca]